MNFGAVDTSGRSRKRTRDREPTLARRENKRSAGEDGSRGPGPASPLKGLR